MPWKEAQVTDSRRAFIEAIAGGSHSFRSVCEDFGISTKTGYKWKQRYQDNGEPGLKDQSRRPHQSSERLSEDVILQIIKIKQFHMSWGAKKILAVLTKNEVSPLPSLSSINRILRKLGLS